jgi:hypothetical protein
MKPAVLLCCGLAVGLLGAGTFACGRSGGTYVLLMFDGSAAGKDIGRIDVQLQFGTRTDSASFAAPAGTSITLPTTAALQIRSGQGDLGVAATARAADGSPLASGSGYGRVVDGQTATITVTFVAGVADAGVDGGAGQPEAGAETGPVDAESNDGAVLGQGGTGGSTLAGGGDSGAGSGGTGGAGGIGGAGGTGGVPGHGGATVFDAGGTGNGDAAVNVDVNPAPFVLSLSSTTLNFGPTLVGSVSAPQTLTVTNVGGATSPPLSVSLGDGRHFPFYQDSCSGATLAPSSRCMVTFTFSPDTLGPLQVNNTVNGGTQTATFVLSGTGVSSASTISLSPQSVDFNNVDVGITVPTAFTVTNKAATDSGPIRVSVSPTSSFQITNDQCSQTTLAQLGQCTFTLVFSPHSLGTVSGTVLAESATSSTTSTVTGTGQDHVQLTVQFSGNGGGSVSALNFNCSSTATSCRLGVTRTDPTSFPTINLSALPNTLSVFAGWSGSGCTGAGSCAVVMDTNKTVTAKFNAQ